MVNVAVRSQVTAGDYLSWERDQPEKHEFYDGEIFAMSGGSPRHNRIGNNVQAVLNRVFAGTCSSFTSDQRVGLADGRRYVYPDATVVCGPFIPQEGTKDVLSNPTIIVEVLSASTEHDDRGIKWTSYQQLPSLCDYVLVSQREVRVEHFQRASDGAWRYRAHGAGEHVELSGARIGVDELYAHAMELPADD